MINRQQPPFLVPHFAVLEEFLLCFGKLPALGIDAHREPYISVFLRRADRLFRFNAFFQQGAPTPFADSPMLIPCFPCSSSLHRAQIAKSRCSSGFSHIKKQSRLFAGLLFAFFALNYSVLSAATGSRFAAPFAGISPPISVSTTLSTTSITAPPTGSTALTSIEPVRL